MITETKCKDKTAPHLWIRENKLFNIKTNRFKSLFTIVCEQSFARVFFFFFFFISLPEKRIHIFAFASDTVVLVDA